MPDTPPQDSFRPSRRRLLAGAAAVGGLTAASFALPSNLSKAMAATAGASLGGFSPKQVKHVVQIMMENRSFDHYFGTMPGVRGFGDPDAIKLSTGKSVFYQPDPKNPAGYPLPWHLDTRTTGAQAIPDTSHAWLVQHSAWNGGKMDNWVPAHRAADGDAHGPFTMGHYERQDIPCLKFCEAVTGVPAAGISAWRRKTVSDLTGAFSGQGFDPKPPVFPDTAGELQLASYTSKLPLPPVPGASQSFPVQPRGHRPHTR